MFIYINFLTLKRRGLKKICCLTGFIIRDLTPETHDLNLAGHLGDAEGLSAYRRCQTAERDRERETIVNGHT